MDVLRNIIGIIMNLSMTLGFFMMLYIMRAIQLIKKDETLKKGEMVVVIEGSEEKQYITVENEKILFEEIQKLNGTKAASKIVSKISSKTSKEIYSIFAEPKNDK